MNYSMTVQNLSEKRGDPGTAGMECQEPVAENRGRRLWNETQPRENNIIKFSV